MGSLLLDHFIENAPKCAAILKGKEVYCQGIRETASEPTTSALELLL
jgi:hypothetical protein